MTHTDLLIIGVGHEKEVNQDITKHPRLKRQIQQGQTPSKKQNGRRGSKEIPVLKSYIDDFKFLKKIIRSRYNVTITIS